MTTKRLTQEFNSEDVLLLMQMKLSNFRFQPQSWNITLASAFQLEIARGGSFICLIESMVDTDGHMIDTITALVKKKKKNQVLLTQKNGHNADLTPKLFNSFK